MTKRDKEKDYTLELCPPPEHSFSFTQGAEESNLNSHDVKNLKAEEKRIYEIENCEVSKIVDEQQPVAAGQELKDKEQASKNLVDVTSRTLERINIFEISNNQMF